MAAPGCCQAMNPGRTPLRRLRAATRIATPELTRNNSVRFLHVDHRTRLSRTWMPISIGPLKKAEADMKNVAASEDFHSRLVGAGFLRQAYSGLFHMLPLGLRVQDKIEAIIEKHMQTIGASRVSLSSISSERLWQRSGRIDNAHSHLFKFRDRKGFKFLLSPTHEEEITELVSQTLKSYKDLPIRLYQITRKYRDELRPRHGLLRSREFTMKDLYTFDVSAEVAMETYQQVRSAYDNIFAELRLPVLVAEASSGDMGGDLSHEYHLASPVGDDDVLSCSACDYVANAEVAPPANAPGTATTSFNDATCPRSACAGTLQTHRAVELGHTFHLGTRYSAPLGAAVAGPSSSTPQQLQMGCHGIGVSRILGAVAAHRGDARGLHWPRAIAPFEVAVLPLGGAGGAGRDGEDVYDVLAAAAGDRAPLDVVLDDRGRTMGWMFNDADAVGYPVRVIVGRAWQKGEKVVEVQCRQLEVKQEVRIEDLNELVRHLLGQL